MRKRLNIVHLIASMGVGGAEKVIIDLLEGIDKERFNIKVAYWMDKQELLEIRGCPETQIVKLSLDKIVTVKSVVKIANLLKYLKADILQTHLIDADLIGTIAAKLVGVPVLNTIHSYPFPIKKSHCFRYKALSLLAKHTICVSETVKKHVVSHSNINPDRILVVHNGLDVKKYSTKNGALANMKFRQAMGIDKNCKIVGNISRLIEDKGHKDLLMAIPEVLKIHPNTKFLIVGDGELRDSLLNLSKSLEIEKKVIFAGSRSDVPELLNLMDIFVFPTFNEALGICVLEAMSMGKPIIATDDAAIPELIENNREGILIHPGSHNAISGAIIDLLNNPRKCEKLSESAKKKVSIFSNENMVNKIEKIYLKIAN